MFKVIKEDVNLYTIENCPKCKIAKSKLQNYYSNKEDVDFRIIELDPLNKSDTDIMMLKERNINTLPVLLVGNDFYDFKQIMELVGSND